MSENLYAPPAAPLIDPAPLASQGNEFFVVSPRKFLLLFVTTLGMYQLYWFYMHWARFRTVNRQKMLPIARAAFSIFFTHALTRQIDNRLRRDDRPYPWSASGVATVYVALAVTMNIFDRLAFREIGSPITDLIGMALVPVLAVTGVRIQKAANLACGDPEGESNQHLTWANWIWLVIGALFWILCLLGFFLPE